MAERHAQHHWLKLQAEKAVFFAMEHSEIPVLNVTVDWYLEGQ